MHEASDSASAEVIAQRRFYRGVLELMNESRIPYVVGGGYALEHYTGSARDSKDLDRGAGLRKSGSQAIRQ